jgi:uncharacterized protein (UPF0548 family)
VGKTARVSELTYVPVGATRTGDLPPHYRHLRYRLLLGAGDDLYRRAGEAIVTFGMHRATGATVKTDGDRADPGVRLRIGAGPLTVPCEIVWTAHDERRTGFGYGTLPGHQASGEEAFLAERDAGGRVWFTVTAYSRPARLAMLVAGPLAEVAQRLYARQCGRALRRVCTVNA